MGLCLALAAVLLLPLPQAAAEGNTNPRPHLLFILADDWGWGDASWSHRADIPTPNLDQLRQESLELTQFYTQPKCTPARAALLTGRYPYKMGLQTAKVFNRVVNNTLDYRYKLLPEYLQDLGYRTHMVGKWHLGDCNVNATPTSRGFDTYFGSSTNVDDHFTLKSNGIFNWHWNNEPYWPAQGNFSADLVTNHTLFLLNNHFSNETTKNEPLFLYVAHLVPHKPAQAPERYITETKCNELPEQIKVNDKLVKNKRRAFCGMVAAMDDGVGQIMQTLKKFRVHRKFITIVTSDNGGAIGAGASNFPLRGNKQSVYEGGTRVRTLLHAPKYLKKGKKTGRYEGLVHITDMLPTLLEAAKGKLSVLPKDIDGMSAWRAIRNGRATKRHWMVYNIDSTRKLGALRFKNGTDDFKLIYSDLSVTEPGYRYQDPRSEEEQKNDPREQRYRKNGTAYFLYNLATNPDERPPLGDRFPDAALDNAAIFNAMKEKLAELTKEEVDMPFYALLGNKEERQRGGAWRITGC